MVYEMSGDGGAARTKVGARERMCGTLRRTLVLLEGGVVVRRSQKGGS